MYVRTSTSMSIVNYELNVNVIQKMNQLIQFSLSLRLSRRRRRLTQKKQSKLTKQVMLK